MQRETITVEDDGYWYRLVVKEIPHFLYSWGDAEMRFVWRANLYYKGRNTYVLRNRTCNGLPKPYRYGVRTKSKQIVKPRHKSRNYGYGITLRLIMRLLEDK